MKKFLMPSFHLMLLFFFLFLVTRTSYAQAPVAPVNPPSNGFYINGKLKADSADVGDWVDGVGTGGFVLQASGAPPVWGPVNSTTTKFIKDPYDDASDMIFQGSSFGDNPNSWQWTTNKATSKCDINTALFHSTTSTTQKWLILGGDRFTTTGTSYIDFQFSQGIFSRTSSGGFSSVAADGSSLAGTNGRTVGDFVLSMEYTNGGATATVHYYRWQPSGNTFKFVELPIPALLGLPSAYGASNTAATDVPYSAFGSTSYIPFAFVEAAVNIDAILNSNCQSVTIKTIFVSTKASDSYTAALKDFVEPQQVNFVFGSAGLSYGTPSFCKNASNPAPTVPSSPAGTFVGSSGLSIDGSTGVINLTTTDAGTYTATYTPSSGACIIPATTVITIKPTPTVSTPSNQLLCNGASTSAVNFSGTPTGVTFNWINNNASIGLGTSGAGNIASFTATNSGTSNSVANITITPSADGCTGNSTSFTITVKPTPTVNTPGNQNICNGASTSTVNFSSVVSGTTFNWTNNNTSIGLGASGSGDISAFTASNSATSSAVATITITPTATGCPGASTSFTITVKPTPTVNTPTNQTLCSGASTTIVSFSSVVSGTTFNWTNNNTLIGLGANGSGNIASFATQNAGASDAVATITITPTANSCAGTSTSFTITVKPQPPAPSLCIVQPTLCGSATGIVKVTSPLVANYQYTKDNGANWQNCNVFLGVVAGSNPSIKYKTELGCVSANADCTTASICAQTPVDCQGGNFARVAPQQATPIEESQTTVKAYPNPFSDRVKFLVTSTVSGNGNLEVYNMMGQKVKTVYQGYIAKGTQTFELSLPKQNVGNLVYVLRIGDNKMTGKILQLNQ